MKRKKLFKIISFLVVIALVFVNTDIILGESGQVTEDKQCTNGGPGSTSCSGSWTIAGVTTSCSVSCGSGFYSCCYLGWDAEAHCVCKSSTKGKDTAVD